MLQSPTKLTQPFFACSKTHNTMKFVSDETWSNIPALGHSAGYIILLWVEIYLGTLTTWNGDFKPTCNSRWEPWSLLNPTYILLLTNHSIPKKETCLSCRSHP
jgi:hypothetical protein